MFERMKYLLLVILVLESGVMAQNLNYCKEYLFYQCNNVDLWFVHSLINSFIRRAACTYCCQDCLLCLLFHNHIAGQAVY